MPLPIMMLGFIILLGLCLNPLLSLGTIGFVLAIVIFLFGWFIIWGIGANDKGDSLMHGVKNGLTFLKYWVMFIAAAAIIAGIFFVITH